MSLTPPSTTCTLPQTILLTNCTIRWPLAGCWRMHLASIDSLETFPGRFPVIDEPLLASHQLHFVPVQNYLLFYRIDSSTQTVHILRFLYGHSDWQAILRVDVLPT